MSLPEDKSRLISVSCVVLNFGFAEFVVDCLTSLDRSANRSEVEIILVDNGSSPEDAAALKAALAGRAVAPDRFIELPVNQGFAAGMNAGIAVAGGNTVIAINSDTIVGTRTLGFIARSAARNPAAGFFAVPIYNAALEHGRLRPGTEIQAEVVGLTWYASCMPVRAALLSPRFVLGPPGCFVVMSRKLIDALTSEYGCVYDPHFFLYGEDVDLFLRARRLGFETCVLSGTPATDDIVWHAGSASTGEGAIATVHKAPPVVAMILNGFRDNAVCHAGWLELPAVILLNILFRCLFSVAYVRANSLRAVIALAREKRRRMPAQSAGARPILPCLLPQTALLHTRVFPWARRRPVTG